MLGQSDGAGPAGLRRGHAEQGGRAAGWGAAHRRFGPCLRSNLRPLAAAQWSVDGRGDWSRRSTSSLRQVSTAWAAAGSVGPCQQEDRPARMLSSLFLHKHRLGGAHH